MDDIDLAASEVVANATEHAEGPYELRLRTFERYLVVEVHDRGHELPELPGDHADTGALRPDNLESLPDALLAGLSERGRGLGIVSALVEGRLAVRKTPTGKCVAIAVPMPALGWK
jgi:anti-sigma regulatory factor (Ser/Thr protein kinase)